MEPKFQTSFIPKKPLPTMGTSGVSIGVPTSLKPIHTKSLLLNFATLLFIISLGAGIAVTTWKYVLKSNTESYKKQLVDKQKEFNPELIRELKMFADRVDINKRVLDKHLAVSGIFNIVSKLTIDRVRFIDMSVTSPDLITTQAGQAAGTQKDSISISLTGYGANLSSVAFQAQVLSDLAKYGLGDIVINPVIANPDIDTSGSVGFTLKADVSPDSLLYTKENTESSAVTPTNQ